MTQKKKELGVGAIVFVKKRYMHPQKLIREFYPNWTMQDNMTDLLVIGQSVHRVGGKDQMCVDFRHDSFPNKAIYCVKRWAAHVVSEGDPTQFFSNRPTASEEDAPTEEGAPISEHVYHLAGNDEDIAHIRRF